METPFAFSIGPDGDVTVTSYDELEKWLTKEREKWNWLVRGDGSTDRHGIATTIQNAWDQVFADVASLKAQGHPLEATQNSLAPLASGPILVSTTSNGTNVLDIRKSSGDLPASFAAGFVTSQHLMNSAQSRDDLLGALLTVIPDIRDAANWSDLLKRERANFKMATRSVIEKVDAEAAQRQLQTKDLVSRASLIARRIFDRKRSNWQKAEADWQNGADAAVKSISDTEAAYKEFMKLKAPVEYWQNKATEHQAKENTARVRLYVYFPTTMIGMAIAFALTAKFLINHPDTATDKAPIALYVVISGGLLLLSTLVFWIGRLLTKLYLSEHHLRNDAEERAVMTTTYLALTNEGEAQDVDRQIVLGALFRATPDGIVKDDGPSEATLQGLLTKLLTR